jgi:oligopeptide/dipeptide ABC transporter ATP-binding protein
MTEVEGKGEIKRADLPILEIRNLKKYFPVKSRYLRRRLGWLRAVDDISFTIQKGEIFGIVGESGCGKSTLGKTILGIYRVSGGEVYFNGEKINDLPWKKLKIVRKKIQYVYQDPGASLDPWWRIGKILREPLLVHEKLSSAEMNKEVKLILKDVGLDEDHMYRFPHEFSGGQQRRLGLARILILNPSMIIFDEPTSGLDVSVQATILNFFKEVKELHDLTYIFISHDLEIIRMMTDRVAVMYLGKIVEYGNTRLIFESPEHPYTRLLLSAIPKIEAKEKEEPEEMIVGEIPDPHHLPPGCRFQSRCSRAKDRCGLEEPQVQQLMDGRFVACHLDQ